MTTVQLPARGSFLSSASAAPEIGIFAAAWRRRRIRIWLALVCGVGIAVASSAALPQLNWIAAIGGTIPAGIVLLIFFSAMVCEFIDSSLGMGYGTTLGPVLLLAGYDPHAVVPAVLLSEFCTGLLAAALHHRDRNVDFVRDRRARGTALLLLGLTIVGAGVASLVASRVAGRTLSLMIASIVLAVGIAIVLTIRRQLQFRPIHLLVIGAIAAFNKGISGGGYGPLVTAGQVVSGMPSKQAVAITSLAEGLTCFVSLAIGLAVGQRIDWNLALPLTCGALASVPLATLAVKRVPERLVRSFVGVATIALGLATLIKAGL